eukprot:Nk52_evm9s226 gene=Nk52_evmTU9s226
MRPSIAPGASLKSSSYSFYIFCLFTFLAIFGSNTSATNDLLDTPPERSSSSSSDSAITLRLYCVHKTQPYAIKRYFTAIPSAFGPGVEDTISGGIVFGDPRDGCDGPPGIGTYNPNSPFVMFLDESSKCDSGMVVYNAAVKGAALVLIARLPSSPSASEPTVYEASQPGFYNSTMKGAWVPSFSISYEVSTAIERYTRVAYCSITANAGFETLYEWDPKIVASISAAAVLLIGVAIIMSIYTYFKRRDDGTSGPPDSAGRYRMPKGVPKEVVMSFPVVEYNEKDELEKKTEEKRRESLQKSGEESVDNGQTWDLDSNDEELCAICLEAYVDKDRLKLLPCNHRFHLMCIDPWLLTESRACPMCKRCVLAPADTDTYPYGEDATGQPYFQHPQSQQIDLSNAPADIIVEEISEGEIGSIPDATVNQNDSRNYNDGQVNIELSVLSNTAVQQIDSHNIEDDDYEEEADKESQEDDDQNRTAAEVNPNENEAVGKYSGEDLVAMEILANQNDTVPGEVFGRN